MMEESKKKLMDDNKTPAENKELKTPAKFEKIVGEIEKMTVIELAELVKILEAKFGVSASVPATVAATSAAVPESSSDEKTFFNLELKEVGTQKIEVIKIVRDITAKGLKESKDFVDAVASSPQIIKEGIKKEEAEEIRKKFEAVGAKVEIK